MFRAHVLIIRSSKLHYTASGIITPIGGRLVHETTEWTITYKPQSYLTSSIVMGVRTLELFFFACSCVIRLFLLKVV